MSSDGRADRESELISIDQGDADCDSHSDASGRQDDRCHHRADEDGDDQHRQDEPIEDATQFFELHVRHRTGGESHHEKHRSNQQECFQFFPCGLKGSSEADGGVDH